MDPKTQALTPITSNTALTKSSPSQSVPITVPTPSAIGQKWTLKVTGQVANRVGNAYLTVKSLGPQQLKVSGPSAINYTVGSAVSSSPITVTDQGGNPVTTASLKLVGAPDGLYLTGANTIAGIPYSLLSGTYSFKVMAQANGYVPATTSVSLVVASGSTSSATINSFAGPDSADNGYQFALNWAISGNILGASIQENQDYPRDVKGVNTLNASIQGTSVFSLVATDFIGPRYTTPICVKSTAAVVSSQLPPASLTIGYILQDNTLNLNWNPPQVQGDYSLYQGWDIQVKLNNGTTQTLTNLDGTYPTGLLAPGATPDSRIYNFLLQNPGSVALNMFPLSTNKITVADGSPWSSFLSFPDVLSESSLSISKTSAYIGEPITVTANLTGGADQWRIVYGDGTASAWRPLSTTLDAHVFQTSGNTTVTLEVQNDFQSVKLRRSWTKSLYILDQQYNPTAGSVAASLGDIGIGGEAGFEITNATGGNATNEPYEVIVRALVKDEMTQELKLLVATSRTRDASSMFGTMALDVFPLKGRPHFKELVKPTYEFTHTTQTSAVKITTTSLPSAVVGKPLSEFQLSASGGLAPYSWFSDNLPQGLKLSTDGTLSGMTMSLGTFSIGFSVKDYNDPNSIDQKTLTLLSVSDLAITNTSVPDAQVTMAYNYSLVGDQGVPPYTWRLVGGSLPTGLTLTSQGALVGFPASYFKSDFATPFTFTVEVTDSLGSKVSKNLSMKLKQAALTLGDVDQNLVYNGQDFKLSVPVYGGVPPYTLKSLSSDAVQNSLTIINPASAQVVSGKTAVPLTIVTDDQSLTMNYGTWASTDVYSLSFSISATGGTAPYLFSIDTSNASKTTISNAAINTSGLLTGTVTLPVASPSKSVSVFAKVTDAMGKTVSKVINANCTLVNIPATNFKIVPAAIASDGTVTILPALPTLIPGQQGSSVYYGLALCKMTNGSPVLFNVGGGIGGSFVSSFSGADFPTPLTNVQVSKAVLFGNTGSVTSLVGPGGQSQAWVLNFGNKTVIPLNTSNGVTPSGNNNWTVSLTADMSAYGGSSSQVVTGSFDLLVGQGTLPHPILNTTPNFSIGYTQTTNSDGSVSYSLQNLDASGYVKLFDYSSSISSGTPPYTIALVPGVSTLPGLFLNGSIIYLDSHSVTGDQLNSWVGSKAVTNGVTITDSLGQHITTDYYLNVTKTAVSNLTMNITANTLDDIYENGATVSGYCQSDNLANWTVTTPTPKAMVPTLSPSGSTSQPSWGGSFRISGDGIVKYTTRAVSVLDSSKYATADYYVYVYNRSITLVPSTATSVQVGGAVSCQLTLRGYTKISEASGISVSLVGPSGSKAKPLYASWGHATKPLPGTLETLPCLTTDVAFTTDVSGSYYLEVKDSARPTLNGASLSCQATAPSVSITGVSSVSINVDEYSVVPGLGWIGSNTNEYTQYMSVPNPFQISGGTAPFQISVQSASVSNGQTASVVSDSSNTSCSYNIGAVQAKPGDTITYTVSWKNRRQQKLSGHC
jgi:hypothetical protein